MGTPATLDDVMEAVCNSRAEGDEALAATALLLGAVMVRASVHIRVLDKRLDTTGERIAQVESERDAALAARDAAQSALAVAKLAADKDREFLRLARDDAEMFAGQRDAVRVRAETAVRERDEAIAACNALRARPTYEVRTVAPTQAERAAHAIAGGAWLVTHLDRGGQHVTMVLLDEQYALDGATYIALDARRLPCAWPVVPSAEAS